MISLIIAVYKNIPALKLILQSVQAQTFRDIEVIIAEDGEDLLMKSFIESASQCYDFPIIHVSHPDTGFRKIIIGNIAIQKSQGEYVVFIDGDCFFHPRFLESYHRAMQPGNFYFGRRVMLGTHMTESLYNSQSLTIPSFISLMMSDSTQIRESVYLPFLPIKEKLNREIWGCNWGIYKQHMLDINGFDEDYYLPCFGEDLDIDWRLSALGLKRFSLKNKAIQYHLHHTQIWDADIEAQGRILYDTKRLDGMIRCTNGIEKLSRDE
jgi:glycosyltransferase involved in cell wall biosynthesis